MVFYHRCQRIVICSVWVAGLCAYECLSAAPHALADFAARREDVHHWREAQSCGVACGYLLARLLGRNITYEDAVEAIVIRSGGTSLTGLKNGLGQLKVETWVVRAKPSDFESIRMPVIVHTLPRQEAGNQMGHFLLVLKISDHFVWYIEPNYAASIEKVTRNQFFRCWTGYSIIPKPDNLRAGREIDALLSLVLFATIVFGFGYERNKALSKLRSGSNRRLPTIASLLLIVWSSSGCGLSRVSLVSDSEAGSERGRRHRACQLLIGTTDVDVGILPQAGEATARFSVENQGDDAVRLELGAPTCRCTNVAMEKSFLEPGEMTSVRMSMRSGHLAGPSQAQVYIAAEGRKWADTLHIHGVQCGARFPEYTYFVGGPAPRRTATIAGSLFLRDASTTCRITPSLAGTGLERMLAIQNLQIGEPIEFPGYVERKCSFMIAVNTAAAQHSVGRRHVMLPIFVRLGETASTQEISLAVLPSVGTKH